MLIYGAGFPDPAGAGVVQVSNSDPTGFQWPKNMFGLVAEIARCKSKSAVKCDRSYEIGCNDDEIETDGAASDGAVLDAGTLEAAVLEGAVFETAVLDAAVLGQFLPCARGGAVG